MAADETGARRFARIAQESGQLDVLVTRVSFAVAHERRAYEGLNLSVAVLHHERQVQMTRSITEGMRTRVPEATALVGRHCGESRKRDRFLCSEGAGYVTGRVLQVNGGMYM